MFPRHLSASLDAQAHIDRLLGNEQLVVSLMEPAKFPNAPWNIANCPAQRDELPRSHQSHSRIDYHHYDDGAAGSAQNGTGVSSAMNNSMLLFIISAFI